MPQTAISAKQHLTILTGASRGMGLAMAQQLLQPGAMLLCISRQRNAALQEQADAAGAVLGEVAVWGMEYSSGRNQLERLRR